MRTAYIHGQVYSGTMPLQEAFVVEDNVFIDCGSNEMILSKYSCAEVVDLEGRFVCAGFNDSHMHVLNYGYGLATLQLSEHTDSLQQLKEYLKKEIKEREIKGGQWLRGRGWNHDFFQDGHRFPTRYDLDEVSKDIPICLVRACGHACVVNSKALALMGITKDSIQPQGGQFDLDEQGEPNGIFRENALDLVYSCLPQPTREELKAMLVNAMQQLNRYGITSSQTDDFVVFHGLDYHEVIEAYKELEQENKLTVRIYQQNHFTCLKDLKQFVEEGGNTGVGSEYFRFGPLKMLGDGSLGARTALMSEPYADDPSTCGIPVYTQETFDEMIGYAHQQGMQVAIHAIGDGILDRILNAIEKALHQNPRKDHRHGIVHCQITRPDQLERMAKLNLHCYAQTIFLDYDIKIVEERVGKQRASSSYNFKTLMDLGVTVSNGSDCPVELPNCMGGIQCAVTRRTLKEQQGPYLQEQALTVQQALDTFTSGGAYASFEEKMKGKIEMGMLADFVILSENPMSCDPNKLKDIQVEATMLGGKCVYQQTK